MPLTIAVTSVNMWAYTVSQKKQTTNFSSKLHHTMADFHNYFIDILAMNLAIRQSLNIFFIIIIL